MSLIALQLLIMVGFVISSNWISNNVQIYEVQIGAIMLRLSLFAFMLGIWIGYFKLILQFIDNQKQSILSLFKFFYLLPKIVFIRLLSYLTTLPIFIFITNKFPYDIQKYGTNIENYFSDLLYNLSIMYSDEISWNLSSAYFNYTDMIVLIILTILPMWFVIRFWCVEIMIIDKEYTIKESLLLSYLLTKKMHHFIAIGILISLMNMITIFLGFIFFIISLTVSYIIIFNYYRLLLNKK